MQPGDTLTWAPHLVHSDAIAMSSPLMDAFELTRPRPQRWALAGWRCCRVQPLGPRKSKWLNQRGVARQTLLSRRWFRYLVIPV